MTVFRAGASASQYWRAFSKSSAGGIRVGATKSSKTHGWIFCTAGALVATLTTQQQRNNTVLFDAKKGQREVKSWGFSLNGQLGHGDIRTKGFPKAIEALRDEDVTGVAGGGSTSAAINSDGEVFTWGRGEEGRLGHSDESDQYIPRVIDGLQGKKVVKIACGEAHMVAITDKGEVFIWGKGVAGRLGLGDDNDSYTPAQLKHGEFGKIVAAACGRQHTCVVDANGNLFSFGSNFEGQLGVSEDKQDHTSPVKVEGVQNVVQVACGHAHTLALTRDGKVYSFGADDFGQLGHGKAVRNQRTPKLVRALKSKKIVAISCGEYHSAALTECGEVYMWGYGKDGQNGHGTHADESIPRLCQALTDKGIKVKAISLGSAHSAVISEKNIVYMWGKGRENQLGRGDVGNRSSPVIVEELMGSKTLALECGSDHTVAIVEGQ